MVEETDKRPSRDELTCRQFEQRLAAYLEGDCVAEVPAHTQHCHSCRAILADLEFIRGTSRQLPLLEPVPAVWGKVRAALKAEGIVRPPGRAWRYLFPEVPFTFRPAPAAALASLVMLGWFLLVPSSAWEQWQSSGRPAASGSAPVAAAVIAADEADMLRTIRQVEAIYRARELFFEPALKATYERGLDSLNRSIGECLAALRQQPTNALAREYLHRAYAQKIEVLASALDFDAR